MQSYLVIVLGRVVLFLLIIAIRRYIGKDKLAGIRINLETIREVTEKGKEVFNVCKAFDDHMERGRREGKKEGRAEGRIEGKKEDIKNLMRNLSVSLEQAMELLGISEEERDKYLSVN